MQSQSEVELQMSIAAEEDFTKPSEKQDKQNLKDAKELKLSVKENAPN